MQKIELFLYLNKIFIDDNWQPTADQLLRQRLNECVCVCVCETVCVCVCVCVLQLLATGWAVRVCDVSQCQYIVWIKKKRKKNCEGCRRKNLACALWHCSCAALSGIYQQLFLFYLTDKKWNSMKQIINPLVLRNRKKLNFNHIIVCQILAINNRALGVIFKVFSIIINFIFAFFIKLIWLGVGFLNRTSTEIQGTGFKEISTSY